MLIVVLNFVWQKRTEKAMHGHEPENEPKK